MKKILRWIFFIFLDLVGIFMVVWITLQFPGVQTFILGKVTKNLSTKLKVPVRISRVNIHFFKTIVLEGVYVEDRQKDTLLYAGKLKVNLGILSLARKTININYTGLEDAYINVYRRNGAKEYNFGFILDAFASDTTKKDTTSSGWDFDMSDVELKNVRLGFYNDSLKTDLWLGLRELNVDIKTLGLKDHDMKINEINLDALNLHYNMIAAKSIQDTVAKAIQKNVVQAQQIQQTAPPGQVFKLSIGDIEIKDTRIAFNNLNFPVADKGIDFNHLGLSAFNAKLNDIFIAGADFAGEIKEFKFLEKSGFALNNFAVEGSIKNSKLHVELNEFITPHSHLDNKVTVDIPRIDSIQAQLADIYMKADFDHTVFSMKDLLYFSPALDTLESFRTASISIDGDLKGKMSDLKFSGARIALNDNNFIKGDFYMKGLPELEKLSFDVKVNTLTLNGPYVASLFPKKTLPVDVKSLGTIQVKLNAKGTTYNFKTDSKINTSAGSAGFDFKVALDKKYFPQELTGNLFTEKFDLGKLLGSQTQLGALTMNADVKSKGREIIDLHSEIKNFYYNKYDYHNITIQGTYRDKVADAEISCPDSNLNVLLNGYFDLRKPPYTYDFTAQIKQLDLYQLHLNTTPLQLHTNINMHAQASDIDSLRAKLLITDFRVMNNVVEYTMDSLKATADYNGGFKTVTIKSPVLNADLDGKFSYKEIPDVIQNIMNRYMSAMKPAEKTVYTDSLRFDIKLGDTKEITQLFSPSLTELRDIELKGNYVKASELLNLNATVGQLDFGKQRIRNIRLDVRGDKEKLNIDFKSSTVGLSQQMQLYNPSFKGTFSHDELRFNLGMKDTGSTSKLNLDGILSFRNDTFKLQLPKADITLRGNDWKLAKEALLLYGPNYMVIRNFNFSSKDQQLSVNTSNENSRDSKLHADIRKLQLGDISKLVGLQFHLEGELNGHAELTDVMKGLGVVADIRIDSMKADQNSIGELSFSARKPLNGTLLDLKTALSGAGNELNITGNYDIGKTDNNLNFQINVDNLNTGSVQPFFKDIFYLLHGKLQAGLHVTGSMGAPEITGKIFFKDEHTLGITAVQTQYKITNQEILFNPASIQFNNFVILDTANQTAKVDGFIYHKNMSGFNMALTFDASNFQFIDSENFTAPIFGRFIADVRVKVTGPIDDIDVNLNVLTKRKTNLSLNIASQKVLSGVPAFISFVSFHRDTSGFNKITLDSGAVSQLPQIDMSRFKIHGNIDVRNDANFNIIINPATGDKITARGDGKFRMSYDSNNGINLFGQFEIDTGNYSLSFIGVVKRAFSISKGSTINFYGDPTQGEMDIKAVYITKASRFDLISDMEGNKTEENAAKIRQNVYLYLKLKGPFLKPDISFDIVAPESKDPMSEVAQRLNQIRTDESQMNKQVFGILVMGKFLPYDGGASTSTGGGGLNETAASTVGTLIADQLNKLSDEYISGVSIQVNTSTQTDLNNNVSNNVSVMATKQVSSRLKVGVGGTTNVGNNGSTQGLAGEYEVDYQINKDGTLSLRLFSMNQQDIYTSTTNQITGFSLDYSKAFDKVKEIFR